MNTQAPIVPLTPHCKNSDLNLAKQNSHCTILLYDAITMWCFLRKGPLSIDKKRPEIAFMKTSSLYLAIVLCYYQTVGRRFYIINNYIHWTLRLGFRVSCAMIIITGLSLSPSLVVTVLNA